MQSSRQTATKSNDFLDSGRRTAMTALSQQHVNSLFQWCAVQTLVHFCAHANTDSGPSLGGYGHMAATRNASQTQHRVQTYMQCRLYPCTPLDVYL
eukprot:1118357-Amphidinium_carterae.1